MTRELKLALIVGFSLVLVVTVLISDHLSKARQVQLAGISDQQPVVVSAPIAEPAPAIPPPSDHRYAMRTDSGSGLDLRGAPPAAHTEIVQSSTGGVFNRGTTDAGDPDKLLIAKVQEFGGDVVDRVGTRDIVLREPPSGTTALTSPPPPPPAAERTHTVIEGDSLCKIAKQYYGDENAWRKLGAANSGVTPESMKIGMKIKLPPSEQITGKPAPAGAVVALNTPSTTKTQTPRLLKTDKVSMKPEAAKSRYASYVVRKGDTVTEIARRHLGSPGRAGEVLRLNESVIEDEDSLQTGMVLRLPLS